MTYAQCMADAKDLKAVLAKWGVPCSIEIQAGRGTDPWASIRKYLRMHHHTASWYRGIDGPLTPVLSLCKTGRVDVVGPLCNGYGGYDGVYRIICMGEANHPGKGGPVNIDGVYVAANSARKPTWGTEWEGGYQDWENIDIPQYRGGMLEFMGRADNALAEWSGRPITSQLEHSTWTTRKSDRRGITRVEAIELTMQYAAKIQPDQTTTPETTTGEFKMPYPVIYCQERGPEYWVLTESGPKKMPGGTKALQYYNSGVAAKVLLPMQNLSAAKVPSKTTREFDQAYSLCRDLATATAGK